MKKNIIKIFSLSMILAFTLCLFSCDVEQFNNYNKQIDLNVYLDMKENFNRV